jgi:predicted dehydrogenase
MSRRASRRGFLKTTALAGTGVWLTSGYELGQAAQQNANNRLNIAIIGCGGRGGGNLGSVSKENIVALCDADESRAAQAYKQYPNVPKYADFRVMLEKQKDIDAVVVSTPDHTHAVASIMAMKMGKHCYCEKPLTHNVYEARQMRLVAAQNKVATQMGNQGTATGGLRTGAEIVQAGMIGDVSEVHVWTNRPIWPQNIARPNPTEPPKTLHWDLWLGPAPHREYHPGVVPFAWRGFWDFGTGALGDMACHTMNLPFMALRLGAPTSVMADVDPKGNQHMNETAPMGCTVTYEFPARGKMPACRLMWYERRKPEDKVLQGLKPSGSGCLMVGSKGTLYASSDYGDNPRLLADGQLSEFTAPQATIPRSPGHHQEWINACKGGTPAMSNFVNYAGPLTEMVLLGNVAMRVGKRVVWDAEKLRAVDLPEADRYIRREYRKGWSL